MKKTSTYTFGVGKRENHDSSLYYSRALGIADVNPSEDLNECPESALGLHVGDSRDMGILPDDSVGLLVTSPPYHGGKDYDTNESFDDYLGMLEDVFKESYRVLEPGGRAVVNVAGMGRKPYVPLQDLVSSILQDVGFFRRGEVIWVKGKGQSGSVAFGSYRKPNNPVLRDVHEYLLVVSKGRFDRVPESRKTPTISKEDFLECTLSVWYVSPESAKRVGHPAPFPVEIPRRCIELYTYKEDVVLDPFMGVASTAVAAVRCGRRFVGWDLDAEYVRRGQTRVDQEHLSRRTSERLVEGMDGK